MRIARWAFIAILIAPLAAVSARAQEQQNDSLAAAARRTQDQKKDQQKDSTKPTKVWDNDNLPDKPGAINVVGQEGQATAENNAANPTADTNPAATPEEKAALEAELSSAKGRLADLKADLDVIQRKFALDQQTYYGKTNYAADKSGAAAIAREKADVDAKKDEVARAEKQMAELQSKLGPASPEKPAAAK